MTTLGQRVPTSYQGHVETAAYGTWLIEALEHVPDVTWPLSVATYSRMRKDPQLAGVLGGYVLPIRRATWGVDPTGCRDEVVQVVADDLGLPIIGVDQPGAARVRGVSWEEYLRTALLHLVWGHYGHELLAQIDNNGRARLIGLSDRIPATITTIHVSDQGVLLGISQDMRGLDQAPQVDAGRLVWNCHEREGSGWYGVSLLRPAFGVWLIKQEMLRVLATSNRRFGMGVPTIEWDTAANPTPAQHSIALQAATAARVGDQTGLVLPPGARLALKGLEGGAPSTLDFLLWLDQQMSRMVLASFLDLGQTRNGSRALGETFVDFFTMSVQATADYVADVVTRQVAARIVGWNWGEDEPVPRVTVADVGSKHEVTAEALQILMQSGAVQPDPELEAWVRAQFRLPPRDPAVPWQSPVRPPAGGKPAGGGPVAAGRPRRGRGKTAEAGPHNSDDPEDHPGGHRLAAAAGDVGQRRNLTADEQASGADFAQIQEDHDAALAALLALWPALAAPIVASLVAAVTAAVTGGALDTLGALAADAAAVNGLAGGLADAATTLAADSAALATAELAGIGLPVGDVAVDAVALADQATATAQLIATGLASAASRTALLLSYPGADPATVAAAVDAELEAAISGERSWVTGTLSSLLSIAQHQGRAAAFQALVDAHGDTAAVFVASEVNDPSTCGPCEEIDGHRFPDFAAALAAYPTGRYVGCEGRDRCRGALFAVPAR